MAAVRPADNWQGITLDARHLMKVVDLEDIYLKAANTLFLGSASPERISKQAIAI